MYFLLYSLAMLDIGVGGCAPEIMRDGLHYAQLQFCAGVQRAGPLVERTILFGW